MLNAEKGGRESPKYKMQHSEQMTAPRYPLRFLYCPRTIILIRSLENIPTADGTKKMITVKIAILAILFVISGGAVFSEWFRTHRGLVFAAALMAIVSSYYLFQSIYDDLKGPTAAAVSTNFSEKEVRLAAIQFLLGDPYGRSEQEVDQNISSIEFYEKGTCGFGANWVVEVFVPQGNVLNNQAIKGTLHFDDINGQFACWNLPFLD